MAYVSASLRAAVIARGRHRCEYCRSPEAITGGPLHVEHVLPEILGGLTLVFNLAAACARCNLHKGTRTRFRDPVSGRVVSLFNPRLQKWRRHFVWSEDGTRIPGRTRSGRATVQALNMNHPTIVMARGMWVDFGIHPPGH